MLRLLAGAAAAPVGEALRAGDLAAARLRFPTGAVEGILERGAELLMPKPVSGDTPPTASESLDGQNIIHGMSLLADDVRIKPRRALPRLYDNDPGDLCNPTEEFFVNPGGCRPPKRHLVLSSRAHLVLGGTGHPDYLRRMRRALHPLHRRLSVRVAACLP